MRPSWDSSSRPDETASAGSPTRFRQLKDCAARHCVRRALLVADVKSRRERPHSVFFNDGSGKRFVEVKFGDKAGATYGFGIGDVIGDGKPDIALARSGAPNVLYLNGK